MWAPEYVWVLKRACAQVSGLTEVKANIKLRFKNNAGQAMVVVRGMQLQQKKSSMTFKQLDGVIRTTNDKGEKGEALGDAGVSRRFSLRATEPSALCASEHDAQVR